MGGRYRVVTYSVISPLTRSDPYVQIESNDLEACFHRFSITPTFTSVLYDTKTKTCIRKQKATGGNPIYLAKAVAFARSCASKWSEMQAFQGILREGSVTVLREKFGEAVIKLDAAPGVPGAVVAHIDFRRAADEGNSVFAIRTSSPLWGGLSGGLIGSYVGGGLLGVVVGATIGASGGPRAAKTLFTNSSCCSLCKGEGIREDYPCLECGGCGNVSKKA